MPLEPWKLQNLEEMCKAAVIAHRREIPPIVTVAQCILESGWGQHMPGNNCFGIKYRVQRHAKKQLLKTKEVLSENGIQRLTASGGRIISKSPRPKSNASGGVDLFDCVVMDWFAAFDSLSECFLDRAHLLVSSYPEAVDPYLKSGVPSDFARGLYRYATSPNYVPTILSIMRNKEVVKTLEKYLLPSVLPGDRDSVVPGVPHGVRR